MTSQNRQGGHRWRKLREQVLREEPFCQVRGPRCTGMSTTVDHVVALALGGEEFDRSNCRGACAACNYGSGAAMGNRRRGSVVRGGYANMASYPRQAWLVLPGVVCHLGHDDLCGSPSLGHLKVGWS